MTLTTKEKEMLLRVIALTQPDYNDESEAATKDYFGLPEFEVNETKRQRFMAALDEASALETVKAKIEEETVVED